MNKLRGQVLSAFKQLHRARQAVFEGDLVALEAARKRINDDFKKNKSVTNPEAAEELLKFSQQVERELRTSVIQAVGVGDGKYQLNLRPEVTRLDNVPYNDCANIPPATGKSKCSNANEDKT